MLLTSKSTVVFLPGAAPVFCGSAGPGRSGAFPGGAVWEKSAAAHTDARKASLIKVDSCLFNLTCPRPFWFEERPKHYRGCIVGRTRASHSSHPVRLRRGSRGGVPRATRHIGDVDAGWSPSGMVRAALPDG